jgi:pilus assembly protein CpaF
LFPADLCSRRSGLILMARAPAEVAPSPLAEIEAQVQARAKDLTLDLGAGPDRESLRRLVEGAIADWGAEHKRGLRPHDLSSPAVVADRVLRNVCGYGPLEPLLADDDVWEIMINAPEGTFAEP